MAIKIIRIQDITVSGSLTVDNTYITVDNTLITCDTTIIADSDSHTFSVIPRFFSTPVKLTLWNELTSQEMVYPVDATEDDGHMEITFSHPVKEGDTYEVRISDVSDRLMWRGKFYCTAQTDIENFTLNPRGTDNKIRL